MPNDWSDYLPELQRQRVERRRRLQRWLTALRHRRVLIGLCVGVYLFWCLCLVLSGMVFAAVLALLMLLFLPPIGYLAWWLVWKEFNQ